MYVVCQIYFKMDPLHAKYLLRKFIMYIDNEYNNHYDFIDFIYSISNDP